MISQLVINVVPVAHWSRNTWNGDGGYGYRAFVTGFCFVLLFLWYLSIQI